MIVLENINNEFSAIDILVNNAGMTVVGTLDNNNKMNGIMS